MTKTTVIHMKTKSEWGYVRLCTHDNFNNWTTDWDKVTCKRCLKMSPKGKRR